jgi:hypothetical protein
MATMRAEWPALIGYAFQLHSIIDSLAPAGVFPYEAPRLRAGHEEIARAEARAGLLPAGYKQFLSYADGWSGFLHTIALFGTTDYGGLGRHAACDGRSGLGAGCVRSSWPRESTSSHLGRR